MKRLNYLAVCGLMFTAVLAFTGCSDDDDEGGGTPNAGNSYITTADGEKLLMTSDGHDSYSYNADGLPTSWGWGSYSISYDPQRLSYSDRENYDFTLNGAGYFSAVSGTYEDEYRKGSYRATFSYDGSGHLVKVSESGSETYYEDGEKYTETGSATTILTWTNGNLTKVEWKYSGNDDGDKYSGTETYTFDYDGDYANPLGQFSHSLTYVYDFMDGCEDLAFFGFYGKSSKQLPSKITEKWTETDSEGTYSDTDIYTASYTFNGNGTLKTEKFMYFTYSYAYSSYSQAPAVDLGAAKTALFPAPQKNTRKHGIFRSHRNR